MGLQIPPSTIAPARFRPKHKPSARNGQHGGTRVPQSYPFPLSRDRWRTDRGSRGPSPHRRSSRLLARVAGRDEQKRELAEYQQKVSMAWHSVSPKGNRRGQSTTMTAISSIVRAAISTAPPPAKAAITGNFDMLVDLRNTGLVLDGSGPTAPAGLGEPRFGCHG